MAPNYIFLRMSARQVLIQILPILPTADPISFLRDRFHVLLLTTAKVVMLARLLLSTTGKHHKKEMKGTRQNAGGRRGQIPLADTHCVLTFLLRDVWSSTWLSRWDRTKHLRKLRGKISRRQEWNEDHQRDLPSSTKTHLNLTRIKHSRLRRWNGFHGSFKHYLCWRHLPLAAECVTCRTQKKQGAEQVPTQVQADSWFTSRPVESTNFFTEDV